MQLETNFYNSVVDSFFKQKKKELIAKKKKQIEDGDFSVDTNFDKIEIIISAVSKIYGISESIIKNRKLAHQAGINYNYREACGMIFFICINKLDWKWSQVIDYFGINRNGIYRYMNYFQDSKKKITKEKYIYICEKIDDLDF